MKNLIALMFAVAFIAIGSVANAECRWCQKCNAWHCDNNSQTTSQVQPQVQSLVSSAIQMVQPSIQTTNYQTTQPVSSAPFYQRAIPNSTMQYAVFPLVQSYNSGNFAQEVLQLTNNYRAQNGLAPLSLSQSMGAQQHAQVMSSRNSMFHGQGYTENVGYGNLTPQRVVNMWINSPTHRQNILGNYQHLDVGKSGAGWVQRFR